MEGRLGVCKKRRGLHCGVRPGLPWWSLQTEVLSCSEVCPGKVISSVVKYFAKYILLHGNWK